MTAVSINVQVLAWLIEQAERIENPNISTMTGVGRNTDLEWLASPLLRRALSALTAQIGTEEYEVAEQPFWIDETFHIDEATGRVNCGKLRVSQVTLNLIIERARLVNATPSAVALELIEMALARTGCVPIHIHYVVSGIYDNSDCEPCKMGRADGETKWVNEISLEACRELARRGEFWQPRNGDTVIYEGPGGNITTIRLSE